MTIKEAIDYLNKKRKELDKILSRYWAVYELFSPDVVSACFEISPEFPADKIIELNQNMIAGNVTKIEEFKDAIIAQIKEFSRCMSPEIVIAGVPKQSIDEAVENASFGAGNLESQIEPMKRYMLTKEILYHKKLDDSDSNPNASSKFLN